MKRNVDLTMNRDFRSNKFTITSLMINKMFGINRPWIFPETFQSTSEYEVMNHYNSSSTDYGFLTGNRVLRADKKDYIGLLFRCNRCGVRMKRKPWDENNMQICKSCEKILQDDYGDKYSWG